jgi:AraC-like DNA-binding protein
MEPRPTPGFIKSFTRLAADPGLQSESVGELARRLGQDPDYLNRRFKRETGLTLRQQRDAIRLEAGKASLLAGSSVGEAAEKAGFDDLNYFSRWFKRHTGMPPSHYVRRPEKSAKKSHSIEPSGLPSPVSGG